jgi:hypothetical protein
MSSQIGEQLATHLRDHLGDGLRTVLLVHDDGVEITYIRDDLEEEYTAETFAEVVETFQLDRPFMSPDSPEVPVGERTAVVHAHENAFVLQFPYSESTTVVASLSQDLGSQLLQFIENCRKVIEHGAEAEGANNE